jgi:hypothetical protein
MRFYIVLKGTKLPSCDEGFARRDVQGFRVVETMIKPYAKDFIYSILRWRAGDGNPIVVTHSLFSVDKDS